MAFLVDGNNLLGRLGGGTREGLVSELAQLARLRRTRLTVVFDGPPEHGRPKVQALGDVTVVCAAPLTADEEIVRRLRESRDPKGLTVITDDRALTSAVKSAGGRAEGIEGFRREASSRLNAPAAVEPTKSAPPIGVKEWERWFSDPKNRMDG